jgi:hypothetical protein
MYPSNAVVRRQAVVEATPVTIGDAGAVYKPGQVINHSIVLNPGHSFDSPTGFSAVSMSVNNTVLFVSTVDGVSTEQKVNSTLSMNESVDSFNIRNLSYAVVGVLLTFITKEA